MAGKRAAMICPKCKAKMKRLYTKANNKFVGIANGCHICGNFIWDHEVSAFDKAWQVLLRGNEE
tara:strand:- start:407 stop:598 length:192 start_codon:yes stop_codon:yes gene_type:complete